MFGLCSGKSYFIFLTLVNLMALFLSKDAHVNLGHLCMGVFRCVHILFSCTIVDFSSRTCFFRRTGVMLLCTNKPYLRSATSHAHFENLVLFDIILLLKLHTFCFPFVLINAQFIDCDTTDLSNIFLVPINSWSYLMFI